MWLRQLLQNHQRSVVAAFICLMAAGLFWAYRGSWPPPRPRPLDKSFYSIDGGTTWFVDPAGKPCPFQHDGKSAYRAYVFADASGHQFVGYLLRYSDEALRQIATRGRDDPSVSSLLMHDLSATEVKKPHDENWVPLADSERAALVMRPTPPAGQPEPVTSVDPNSR